VNHISNFCFRFPPLLRYSFFPAHRVLFESSSRNAKTCSLSMTLTSSLRFFLIYASSLSLFCFECTLLYLHQEQYLFIVDSIPYLLRILPLTALAKICLCLSPLAFFAFCSSCLFMHSKYTNFLRTSLSTFRPLKKFVTFFRGVGDAELLCIVLVSLCSLFLYLLAFLFASCNFCSTSLRRAYARLLSLLTFRRPSFCLADCRNEVPSISKVGK